MCTLIAIRNRVEDWPIVIGANRDEYRKRPWEPPKWDGDVLAPRDLEAGGTWIALHKIGMVVAVTNRTDLDHDPAYPSRGLLALELAATGDPDAAKLMMELELSHQRRNPFQVLVASASDAWVGSHPGKDGTWGEIAPLTDGMHTLTNLWPLDALNHRGALTPLDLPVDTPLLAALPKMKAALRTHGDEGPSGADTICKHGEERGTLSSAIVALPSPTLRLKPSLLFASGTPCENEWAAY